MTFDEAVREYQLRSSIGPLVQGMKLSPFVNVPQQEYDRVKFLNNLFYEIINKLRKEYAPMVEMTKEQHDYIAPLIKEGKELGATFTEFWEVYKYMGASKKIDRTFDSQEHAMQAWLHPETIKIVDE
ncbi:hypothetical protein [Leuconostoc mesenteroides]|uniref:hypothetical protein n=1 Tax=Leuconostoc mesenteroides TaxID=1245 RepID=UPI002073C80F|nr:hypothetical protein [Leuconostoc mesenteroides]MCM6831236.1 hypothetical protein [Leuconostoc mesenteroides]